MLLRFALALSVLTLLAGCSEGGASGSANVDIHGFKFDPATITIQRGDSVTFTNHDSAAHTATGTGFDTGSLSTDASKAITFSTAGTFQYRCTFHASMTGTIVVE